MKLRVLQVNTDHPESLHQDLSNGLEGFHLELLSLVDCLVKWLEVQYGVLAPIFFGTEKYVL